MNSINGYLYSYSKSDFVEGKPGSLSDFFSQISCTTLLLYLLLSQVSFLSAQTLHFKNLGIDDGLTSSTVFDITEDENGYFWIATNKGVSRFDGMEFLNLSHRDGYTGRGAFRICKSSSNELWIITIDFKLFHMSKGKCRQVKLPFDIAWIIENDAHQMIGLSRQGVVFQVSDTGFLDKILFRIKAPIETPVYFTICQDFKGHYFVSSSEGIGSIDIIAKQQNWLMQSVTNYTFRASRMFKTIDGSIYVFNTIGLFALQRTKDKGVQFRKLTSTKGEDIICMYKDTLSNILWVGTTSGLKQLKESNGTVKLIRYLNNAVCYGLFISKEGILWCTTSENGIFYTDISALHFTKEEGLKDDRVSFLCKQGSSIYAVAKKGEMALIENGKMEQNWNLNKYAQFAVIHKAASYEDGIYLVLQGNEFLHISNRVISKIVNPTGYYPLLGANKLYYSYNGATYHSKPFRFWYQSNPKSALRKLTEREQQGNGFIGTLKDSILIYASRRGFFKMYVVSPDSVDYHIINTTISSIVETPKGSLFFSTPDKGIYIEQYDGKRYFYGSDKMLLSDYCSKLYYHNGELWVATDKGISRIILDKKDSIIKVINYTGQDKLISKEVNDILFDRGKVYVATNKGVSYFREQASSTEDYSPVVVLDRIQINNKDTTIHDSYTLPFTQNNITITYNSPSIRSAKNMQYKYAIVGKRTRTIYGVSSSKVLQLGSLAPDEYLVNIWARNVDGLWSVNPAKIHINILQPFWERLEFIISAVSIILLGILLLIIRRVNQVKERNRMQTLLLDSELKALRLHMNPHFIFNTLNSFQKFILEKNPLEANKYIAKFSKLLRWIMLYSDKQHLTLQNELLFLDTYIELEQLRFDVVFKVTKHIDEQLDPSDIFIPALVVQPFVENAIKYGITGIKYRGELTLRFEKREGDCLNVTIEDNGVGRVKVKEEQDFSGKEYESTGIKYTNERLLLLLRDKLKVENAVTISDLYNDTGMAVGTKVELIIPYYNE
ncbi:MAG: histidine kinase [Bacteroidota bacterium]